MLFGNRRPVDFPVLLNPQANSTTQAEGSSSDTISNITTLTLICANLCLKYGLKLWWELLTDLYQGSQQKLRRVNPLFQSMSACVCPRKCHGWADTLLVILQCYCRIPTVPCIALLKQQMTQTCQVDCMVLFISILVFLIRHIFLHVWFYLNFSTNCQVKFYSICIFGGRKWTCTKCSSQHKPFSVCCEKKVVFLGFEREILWTPCKLVKFLPETCWLPASSLLMHLAGGPAFQEL